RGRPGRMAWAGRETRTPPEAAFWAATAGGARALRRDDIGHLRPGARADLVPLDAPSHVYLAYRPGVPLVAAVWQAGELAAGRPMTGERPRKASSHVQAGTLVPARGRTPADVAGGRWTAMPGPGRFDEPPPSENPSFP